MTTRDPRVDRREHQDGGGLPGRAPSPPPLVRSIGEREFAFLRNLVHDEIGIDLSEGKKPLVVGRLSKRLRELGLASFADYCRRLDGKGGAEERVRLFDAISTNETRFFREPQQFEFLEAALLPEWERRAAAGSRLREIRSWSAACSTGEEPFSIAMTLLARFPPESGWRVDILGTDISTRVLGRSEEAKWPIARAAEIPTDFRKAFMLRGRGGEEGRMKAGPEIRSVVHFARLNLNHVPYRVAGPFDLIFCRNVLIYFDAPSRRKVIDALVDQLRPEGLLFLGQAESLAGVTDRLRSVGPAIYAPIGTTLPRSIRADARPSPRFGPAGGSRRITAAGRPPGRADSGR